MAEVTEIINILPPLLLGVMLSIGACMILSNNLANLSGRIARSGLFVITIVAFLFPVFVWPLNTVTQSPMIFPLIIGIIMGTIGWLIIDGNPISCLLDSHGSN